MKLNRTAIRTLASAAMIILLGTLPAYADDRADAKAASDVAKLAKEIQAEVETLRGWKYKHPVKTGVYSEQQLREFITKKVLEEYGEFGMQLEQASLRMVGLIPADCDLKDTLFSALLNQIGGFYDPPTRAFYMLERQGVDYGPLLTRVLIAHELTHALDDQYFDLEKLMESRPKSHDWQLAIGSVVEGSATVLMSRYMIHAMSSGLDIGQEDLMEITRKEMERSRPFFEAPPYFSAMMAPYLCGMFFLGNGLHVDPSGGLANVADNLRATAEDPPQSTEQVLHPEKYWNQARRELPVVIDDKKVERILADAASEWRVVHADTYGELLCAVVTSDETREFNVMTAGLPSSWTNDAATGWGGDRFYLLSRGPSEREAKERLTETRGVWITAWDTGDDRQEFLSDYTSERDLAGRDSFRIGDRVVVFCYGFDDAAVADLSARLSRAKLFTQGGKTWE